MKPVRQNCRPHAGGKNSDRGVRALCRTILRSTNRQPKLKPPPQAGEMLQPNSAAGHRRFGTHRFGRTELQCRAGCLATTQSSEQMRLIDKALQIQIGIDDVFQMRKFEKVSQYRSDERRHAVTHRQAD